MTEDEPLYPHDLTLRLSLYGYRPGAWDEAAHRAKIRALSTPVEAPPRVRWCAECLESYTPRRGKPPVCSDACAAVRKARRDVEKRGAMLALGAARPPLPSPAPAPREPSLEPASNPSEDTTRTMTTTVAA